MERVSVATHRFTREQYERMVEAGVFGPEDRVELIQGEVTAMSPQNLAHKVAVTKGLQVLTRVCPGGYFVCSQIPLGVGEYAEPEPDLAILKGVPEELGGDEGEAIQLVIEVADTALERDRETKRILYAEHGIPEYWIVNLRDEQVEVYREPAGGDYATKRTYQQGPIAPAFADLEVAVEAMLP